MSSDLNILVPCSQQTGCNYTVLYDVKEQIAKSYATCGRLRHIFDSPALNIDIKLRICGRRLLGTTVMHTGVKHGTSTNQPCDTSTTQTEKCWHVTGRSIPTEARPMSTSYNFVRNIHIQIYKWVGMILRSDKDRLIVNALKIQHEMGFPGR